MPNPIAINKSTGMAIPGKWIKEGVSFTRIKKMQIDFI
jgi:hypothetical protein